MIGLLTMASGVGQEALQSWLGLIGACDGRGTQLQLTPSDWWFLVQTDYLIDWLIDTVHAVCFVVNTAFV